MVQSYFDSCINPPGCSLNHFEHSLSPPLETNSTPLPVPTLLVQDFPYPNPVSRLNAALSNAKLIKAKVHDIETVYIPTSSGL